MGVSLFTIIFPAIFINEMAEEKSEKGSVDANGRMRSTTVVKPIVYGNTARLLPTKKDNNHTHEWRIFLRPYYSEDGSRWIRKVTFKLHESYAQSTRTFEKPPYEIRETGWGEFECIIKMYFLDPNEKPVTFYHLLKLFPVPPDAEISAGRKPLISEYYDEIVFQDPSPQLYNALSTKSQNLGKHHTDLLHRRQRSLELVRQARQEVRAEITDLSECLKEAKALIHDFQQKIKKAEAEAPTADG